MKVDTQFVSATLGRLRAYIRRGGSPQRYTGDEIPLRSELFSADQMKQHGKTPELRT